MKKLISILLSVIIVLSVMSVGVFADESLPLKDFNINYVAMDPYAEYSDGVYTDEVIINHVIYARNVFESDNAVANYYTVIKLFDSQEAVDTVTEINIESEINGLPVLSIEIDRSYGEFFGLSNDKVEKITLPDTLRAIGNYSFSSFKKVKELILPENLEYIGGYAFYGMTSLEKITIPKKINDIEPFTFGNCINLKKVKFEGKIKNIASYSFYNSKKLTGIDLPDSLETLNDYAFCGMYALKKIKLPKNITVISKGLFLNCKSLEKVTFKGKITKIMDRAFTKCKALKKINLQNSLKSVGDEAFSNSGLEKVNIPSGTIFGEGAFSYCNKLKKVTYTGKKNAEVAQAMFFGCKKLKNVYIPKTVKKATFSKEAFYNCKSLKTVKIASKKVKVRKDAFEKTPKTCKIYVKNARVKKAILNSGFKGKILVKKNMK